MSIKFSCPHCRRTFNVKDELAGKRAQCTGCKHVISVPVPVAKPADMEDFAAAALADQPAAPEPTKETMWVEFVCAFCDEKIKVSAEFAGKQAPCPECRRIVKVPLPEKKEPKDWRSVDQRLPAGARRDIGPAPEGTWGTGSVGHVSREALVEAKALPTKRERLSWNQRIKRGLAVAVLLGIAGIATWSILSHLAKNRREQALAKAIAYTDSKDKLSANAMAELHRFIGEHYLQAGNAEEALNNLRKARAAVADEDPTSPFERETVLTDLALAQVDLGGDKPDVEKRARINWEQAQKEIRQTLQLLKSPDGRSSALRGVAAKLIARGQPGQAVPLASIFTVSAEDSAQLHACVGLEMLRAKLPAEAEKLANQAQQLLAQPTLKPGEQNQAKQNKPPPPALLTLWLVLGKPDRAVALAPVPLGAKPVDAAVLVGYLEGWARLGQVEPARARARAVSVPPDRLQAFLAIAAAVVDSDAPEAARPDLEEAITLAEKGAPPWQVWQLVKLAVKADMGEPLQRILRVIPDSALRGRAQLEVLLGRLARTRDQVDESLPKAVDKETPAYNLAMQAFAVHNARLGGGAALSKAVDGWEPERIRPFGNIGVATGLLEIKR
jgi:tetratricopeptide (TPR) repeat protein